MTSCQWRSEHGAQFFDDLRAVIWGELDAGTAADGYRRALQRAYLERVGTLMTEEPPSSPFGGAQPDVSRSDIRPLLRAELTTLREQTTAALLRVRNRVMRAHLEDVLARIAELLDP